MNQTGVCGTGSPRAALKKAESCGSDGLVTGQWSQAGRRVGTPGSRVPAYAAAMSARQESARDEHAPEAFRVAPSVFVDNKASNRFTVIEVNAQDRPALLNQLAYALFQSKVTVHSAHVATYGERAVDTFYVTDLIGDKIDAAARVKSLEKRLLEAAASRSEEAVAA